MTNDDKNTDAQIEAEDIAPEEAQRRLIRGIIIGVQAGAVILGVLVLLAFISDKNVGLLGILAPIAVGITAFTMSIRASGAMQYYKKLGPNEQPLIPKQPTRPTTETNSKTETKARADSYKARDEQLARDLKEARKINKFDF